MKNISALFTVNGFFKNIPRTFTIQDPLKDIVNYFLQNPDYHTVVIRGDEDKIVGIITKNHLLEYLFSELNSDCPLIKLMNRSFPCTSRQDIDHAYLLDYIMNNYEDLVVVDKDGRYVTLVTCLNLARVYLDQKTVQGKLFEAILNSTNNGIIAADRDGNIFFFNSAAERILGDNPRRVLGQQINGGTPDSKFPSVLKTGLVECPERKSWDQLVFLTNETPIILEGEIVGAISQLQHVQQGENSSSQLVELEDFINVMKMVMDNAYVGLIFCDKNGIIRFMNRLYEDLLKIKRKNTYGKHITEYFPDSRLPIVIKTGREELGWKYNFMDEKTLVVNRIPIKQRGQVIGAIAQCIFKDISELKEMADKLHLLENKVRVYRKELNDILTPKYTFAEILGSSEAIDALKKLAKLYAKTDAPILITGETGTGKELFAHAIHQASFRSQGPFVCLNCASIPAELVESELFGYAAGAFTGAHKSGKIGKIRLAHRGTLFLDEIGDMPLAAQAKLLRVIEEKTVEPVGNIHPMVADFRLVAATNKDLRLLMQEGKFREDLYYRLGTMTIAVPSLREHSEDIPLLARSFVSQMSRGRINISDEALGLLLDQKWQGNVRELRSVIERALTLVEEGKQINKEHLVSYFNHGVEADLSSHAEISTFDLKKLFRKEEKRVILKALQACKGNKSKAAQLLGISRSLLYTKMKGYQI